VDSFLISNLEGGRWYAPCPASKISSLRRPFSFKVIRGGWSMKPIVLIVRNLSTLALLSVALIVVAAAPQGRGRKVGQPIPSIPRVPGIGGGVRQTCVQSCNSFHRNEAQICRGRTGSDRASCQRSINQQHRLCIQSCPT
jgi:hypothetical protein